MAKIEKSKKLLENMGDGQFNLDYITNIIENLEQCIAVIDLEKRIVLQNSMMMQQFSPAEGAIGKKLRTVMPRFWEEYRGQIWGDILVNDVIGNGQRRKLPRFPMKTCGNKIRYFDLKASPFTNNDAQIIGVILVMEDVTDNIHLENQLLRQARTASLANLGASIAHEIRNPLNSISLNIQLIKEWLQQPDYFSREEIFETVDNVVSEIQRLNDMIRYFLRFSRLPVPQLYADDLNECVRRALRLLTEQARQANVQISENYGKLPQIQLDRNQISQAIYNLCLNALQAMQEQGGGKLEVTTFSNKDYVVVEIKDNGPGLGNQVMDSLFDLFYSTKEDGSGLGLPIANQIVEHHQGRIVAENNLDYGSCFSIYLPVVSTEN